MFKTEQGNYAGMARDIRNYFFKWKNRNWSVNSISESTFKQFAIKNKCVDPGFQYVQRGCVPYVDPKFPGV